MANVDRPNGFRPIGTLSGSPWQSSVRHYSVAATQATGIFIGDAVTLTAVGDTVVKSGAADLVLGIVVGVVVDRDAPKTEHPGYIPANAAGKVLVCTAPDAMYLVQEDSDAGALTADAVGGNISLIDSGGNATTGQSTQMLDSSTLTTVAPLPFRILELYEAPDNEIGNLAKWVVFVHQSHFNSANGI